MDQSNKGMFHHKHTHTHNRFTDNLGKGYISLLQIPGELTEK